MLFAWTLYLVKLSHSGKASCQPKIASVFVEKHNTGQQLHSYIERPKQIAFDDVKKIRKIDEKGSAQSIKVVE